MVLAPGACTALTQGRDERCIVTPLLLRWVQVRSKTTNVSYCLIWIDYNCDFNGEIIAQLLHKHQGLNSFSLLILKKYCFHFQGFIFCYNNMTISVRSLDLSDIERRKDNKINKIIVFKTMRLTVKRSLVRRKKGNAKCNNGLWICSIKNKNRRVEIWKNNTLLTRW